MYIIKKITLILNVQHEMCISYNQSDIHIYIFITTYFIHTHILFAYFVCKTHIWQNVCVMRMHETKNNYFRNS